MIETPHKRFLIFEDNEYYPSGGIHDVIETTDTIQEASDYINTNVCHEDLYIYDRIKGIIIPSL